MAPLATEKSAAQDLKAKKTKSRNGCQRCKDKRLKCDETTPACNQCTRRKYPCPGYSKTLKWSTKYEIHPQGHVTKPLPKPRPTTNTKPKTAQVMDFSLPPDVVNGFEALAAVLPAKEKSAEATEPPTTQQHAPSQSPPPPATAEPGLSSVDTTTEEGDSPQELDSFPVEEPETIDPLCFDGIGDGFQMSEEELNFDCLQDFVVDPGPFDDLGLDIEEIQRQPDDLSPSALNSPRLSRSLLLDFYRLPSPSPNTSSLDDVESLLVQHYFKEVCVLFSSFDSPLNPFRTTIGRVFQDSPSIYYGIQSMAAAHLANTFPHMASIGMDMQRKACDALYEELPLTQNGQASGTRTFLSILLLGITTCWHESTALGEDFLTTARSLILPKLLTSFGGDEVQRETQFFEEALIYWEMLMGFVTEDARSFLPSSGVRSRAVPKKLGPAARRPDGKIVPHPWTGIAPTIQVLFAEVGRLVRRERMLDVNNVRDFRKRHENLLNAATLEEDLLAAEYPMAEELADPGDERTPKHDFVIIAEAYRCTGLLEIYRVFPSILRKRLGSDKFTWTNSIDFEFPTPRFETPYEDTDTKLWINSLALHILKTIESLPSSSGTICIQPILLVAAASELRLVSSVDYFDVDANDAKMLQARQFIDRRLREYSLRLPNKPLRQMIKLVNEVWRRSDAGEDAFWIDVMNENGWHTVMG